MYNLFNAFRSTFFFFICILRHLNFSVAGDCDFLVYCVILYINIFIYIKNKKTNKKNKQTNRSITTKLCNNFFPIPCNFLMIYLVKMLAFKYVGNIKSDIEIEILVVI